MGTWIAGCLLQLASPLQQRMVQLETWNAWIGIFTGN